MPVFTDSYVNEFESILKSYVESGIPIIATMENSLGIGHVVNLIGRSNTDYAKIATLPISETIPNSQNTCVYDFYDLPFEYVMIDDNHAPYRVAPLTDPAIHYSNPKWKGCQIRNIIVPLYHRIYMEADEAKRLAIAALEYIPPPLEGHWILRVFLTSSRSFKNSIACDPKMNNIIKELLINLSMPKFVWIGELSNKNLIINDLACGMIVMDATQPNPRNEALLAYFERNDYYDTMNHSIRHISLPSQPFSIYNNNLKTF